MSFSSDAWARNAALYEKTRTMPFNQELASGQLDENAFRHYMIQDAHYLVAFGRALAIAAAKADHADGVVQFADAAKGAVIVERSLHAGFMKQFGIDAATFEATPLSPASHHYTSFLIATAWSAPYPVALAALLPCFWIYAEIGRDIQARAAKPNPYAAWIDAYAGEEFHALVRAVIATVDRSAEAASAETREAMHQAYTHAAQLEWMFWDSAYRQAGWPV
ncbi:Aminopyrimidine aminohydrolase [Achromobacter veterisilvae]|uniref:Aminopyrimidine aminohydrolase n=1 Tax=Achromobacter veterisilvae TaxID=2069367 RepID=A0A446CCE3_9BURK|nr:thiaminase II [Achromobacter veterisilvae]SSW65515.1 Aminopyrimidine aminohydrolase [Achromobacter veterisilvae]